MNRRHLYSWQDFFPLVGFSVVLLYISFVHFSFCACILWVVVQRTGKCAVVRIYQIPSAFVACQLNIECVNRRTL